MGSVSAVCWSEDESMIFLENDILFADWLYKTHGPVYAMFALFVILYQQDNNCLCHHGWRHCPVHQENSNG